jgi:hypothetical protein
MANGSGARCLKKYRSLGCGNFSLSEAATGGGESLLGLSMGCCARTLKAAGTMAKQKNTLTTTPERVKGSFY